MIESHTHSICSHDGHVTIAEMVEAAKARGTRYLAVTEHCDRDYRYCIKEFFCRQLNFRRYQKAFAEGQKVADGLYLAFGVECGYSAKAAPIYCKEIPKYDFDVIINSVHTLCGQDVYFGKFFKGRTIEEAYGIYLDAVASSLEVPYDYDIVGHFGYVTRYAPYPDKSLMQPQFVERVDKILGRIIALGKTLEVNTHIRAPFPQLPEDAVLRRYFELGGRNITFSSDAHRLTDLGDKFEDTREKLAAMGFAHWTVYVRRKPVRIPLFADAAEITAAIDAART